MSRDTNTIWQAVFEPIIPIPMGRSSTRKKKVSHILHSGTTHWDNTESKVLVDDFVEGSGRSPRRVVVNSLHSDPNRLNQSVLPICWVPYGTPLENGYQSGNSYTRTGFSRNCTGHDCRLLCFRSSHTER